MSQGRKQIDWTWDEVARALALSKGIDSGLWRLSVNLRFAGITLGWQEAQSGNLAQFPTAIAGIVGVALVPTDEKDGPLIFDAAEFKSPPVESIKVIGIATETDEALPLIATEGAATPRKKTAAKKVAATAGKRTAAKPNRQSR